MGPFLVLLFLVAVLIPSCLPDSDEDQDVGSLSTHLPEIQEEIVGKHNELRKSVSPSASNMLKMRWTSEPYENTQKWAENYAHSISAFRRTSVQVVWYSSFLTGCGVAYCPEKSSKYFMVCRYCPAGNYLSRYYVPYDEGEPCASCPDHCDDGLCTNSCDYEDSHAIFHVLAEQGYWGNVIIHPRCKPSCNCSHKFMKHPMCLSRVLWSRAPSSSRFHMHYWANHGHVIYKFDSKL